MLTQSNEHLNILELQVYVQKREIVENYKSDGMGQRLNPGHFAYVSEAVATILMPSNVKTVEIKNVYLDTFSNQSSQILYLIMH